MSSPTVGYTADQTTGNQVQEIAASGFLVNGLFERTQSGLASAKCQCTTLGRIQSLGEVAIKAVIARLAQGDAVAALAREFGTSRQPTADHSYKTDNTIENGLARRPFFLSLVVTGVVIWH